MSGPSKVPGSRTVRHIGTGGGSLLRQARERARREPGEWTFVGASTSPVSEVEARFVRSVINGEKPSLGGGTWDATCERGVLRDGEPVCLSDLPDSPEPGEEVVTLKFIAFLGDDGDEG